MNEFTDDEKIGALLSEAIYKLTPRGEFGNANSSPPPHNGPSIAHEGHLLLCPYSPASSRASASPSPTLSFGAGRA